MSKKSVHCNQTVLVVNPETLQIRISYGVWFTETISRNVNIYKNKLDGVEKPTETIYAPDFKRFRIHNESRAISRLTFAMYVKHSLR